MAILSSINPAWLPAITSGLLAAILTSVFSPVVQHYFWRSQKLREHKLVLAERLATLVPKLDRLFNTGTERMERNLLIGEIDAVLFPIQVLFAEKTKQACYKLHLLLKRWTNPSQGVPPSVIIEYFAETYQAAADALAYVYGDVFSMKLNEKWWIPYNPKQLEEMVEKGTFE